VMIDKLIDNMLCLQLLPDGEDSLFAFYHFYSLPVSNDAAC